MTNCFALLAAGTAAVEEAPTKLLSMRPVDILIVVIYFAVVLAIGFYLKRYTHTGEEFFMAGRKMTAWIAGLSFISANLSSLETMGWSAMAYQYGMLGAHAYFIGAIPAILFLAVVMMPFYYICKTHSVPGYLSLRYGEDSRVLAGLSFTVMTVLVCGVNMFAMAKMLHLLLNWNIHASIWVSSITVAIYVALGGLLSAVLNEVLQFFLIWLGTLLVPILGLIECGGWNGMLERINAANPHTNYTSLWANMGSANDNPMGMHWCGMVFGLGLAVSFGYWCTDFLQVQRVMTAKSLRAAQNGTIIGAVFKMMVPLIVTLPGLLGLALLYQADTGQGVKLLPESEAILTGGRSYNDVLPLMMARYLSPGLLGLGVSAMIAGFMSGMAGNVSAFATVWTYDVYRPLLNRRASDHHYVSMGRWCSIIGVIIAIGTAYAAMLFSNILVYLQVLVLFFIVPLFAVVLMGMLWKQSTRAGGFWGLLLGTLMSIGMFLFVHWFPDGYTRFLTRDLTDLPALAQRLEHPGDPAAQYVAAHLSPATVELLKQYGESARLAVEPTTLPGKIAAAMKEEDRTTQRLKIVLIEDFKRFLGDTSLYDPQRFAAAGLGEPLRTQAERQPQGDELARVNRALLSLTFPGELAPVRRIEATQLNPRHAEIIATSPKAQDMAVNMFSAFWSLLWTIGVVLLVSLFTRPKPDGELTGLVYGLTPVPDEGRCPWYQKPVFWAAVVAVVLVAVNIIFW
jgi:SSS family solute:Na+ symporter